MARTGEVRQGLVAEKNQHRKEREASKGTGAHLAELGQ